MLSKNVPNSGIFSPIQLSTLLPYNLDFAKIDYNPGPDSLMNADELKLYHRCL